MAGLFLLYLISFGFIIRGNRKAALSIIIVTILLCVVMFNHHITTTLNLNY